MVITSVRGSAKAVKRFKSLNPKLRSVKTKVTSSKKGRRTTQPSQKTAGEIIKEAREEGASVEQLRQKALEQEQAQKVEQQLQQVKVTARAARSQALQTGTPSTFTVRQSTIKPAGFSPLPMATTGLTRAQVSGITSPTSIVKQQRQLAGGTISAATFSPSGFASVEDFRRKELIKEAPVRGRIVTGLESGQKFFEEKGEFGAQIPAGALEFGAGISKAVLFPGRTAKEVKTGVKGISDLSKEIGVIPALSATVGVGLKQELQQRPLQFSIRTGLETATATGVIRAVKKAPTVSLTDDAIAFTGRETGIQRQLKVSPGIAKGIRTTGDITGITETGKIIGGTGREVIDITKGTTKEVGRIVGPTGREIIDIGVDTAPEPGRILRQTGREVDDIAIGIIGRDTLKETGDIIIGTGREVRSIGTGTGRAVRGLAVDTGREIKGIALPTAREVGDIGVGIVGKDTLKGTGVIITETGKIGRQTGQALKGVGLDIGAGITSIAKPTAFELGLFGRQTAQEFTRIAKPTFQDVSKITLSVGTGPKSLVPRLRPIGAPPPIKLTKKDLILEGLTEAGAKRAIFPERIIEQQTLAQEITLGKRQIRVKGFQETTVEGLESPVKLFEGKGKIAVGIDDKPPKLFEVEDAGRIIDKQFTGTEKIFEPRKKTRELISESEFFGKVSEVPGFPQFKRSITFQVPKGRKAPSTVTRTLQEQKFAVDFPAFREEAINIKGLITPTPSQALRDPELFVSPIRPTKTKTRTPALVGSAPTEAEIRTLLDIRKGRPQKPRAFVPPGKITREEILTLKDIAKGRPTIIKGTVPQIKITEKKAQDITKTLRSIYRPDTKPKQVFKVPEPRATTGPLLKLKSDAVPKGRIVPTKDIRTTAATSVRRALKTPTKRRIATVPKIKTATVSRTRGRAAQDIASALDTRQKIPTQLKTPQQQRIGTIPALKTGAALGTRQVTKQRTITGLKLAQIPKLKSPLRTPGAFVPPVRPPTVPLIPPGRLKFERDIMKTKGTRKRKFKKTPSVVAIELNIRGAFPKTPTGLGIRPIPIKL